MHIGIIAPYSRPWDSEDAEGSGMNVFIRESAEALAEAGHEVSVFIRRSRIYDAEIEEVTDLIKVFKIKAGDTIRLRRDEVYENCLKNDFPSHFGTVAKLPFLTQHSKPNHPRLNVSSVWGGLN